MHGVLNHYDLPDLLAAKSLVLMGHGDTMSSKDLLLKALAMLNC